MTLVLFTPDAVRIDVSDKFYVSSFYEDGSIELSKLCKFRSHYHTFSFIQKLVVYPIRFYP